MWMAPFHGLYPGPLYCSLGVMSCFKMLLLVVDCTLNLDQIHPPSLPSFSLPPSFRSSLHPSLPPFLHSFPLSLSPALLSFHYFHPDIFFQQQRRNQSKAYDLRDTVTLSYLSVLHTFPVKKRRQTIVPGPGAGQCVFTQERCHPE